MNFAQFCSGNAQKYCCIGERKNLTLLVSEYRKQPYLHLMKLFELVKIIYDLAVVSKLMKGK